MASDESENGEAAHRWAPVGNKTAQGGQGKGRQVRSEAGQLGFEKRLLKPRDRRARGRFLREVTSYQTLDHPQLPRLLDHNAAAWQDRSVDLFLVLDFVDGETLSDYMGRHGPLDLEAALQLIGKVIDAIEHCHENDVVHRDIKPLNIILRDGSTADPVIVDFGLSFNAQDPDAPDLTRVNEEVGNRFLRLPEHATGGRNPASDVAQIVGLLFYLLTGVEPRILVDDEGLAPHQRAAARSILDATLKEPQLRRVLAIFDRGFRTRTNERFETAQQLREGVNAINMPDSVGDDYDDLLSRLDDAVAAVDHQEQQRRQLILQRFFLRANNVVQALAGSKELGASQGGGPDGLTAPEPFRIISLALAPQGVIAQNMVVFRFTLVGTNEVEMSVDGATVWRGLNPEDPVLERSIIAPVVERYLETYG